MRIIELVIDPDEDVMGVDAISLVNQPAIERNFVTLRKHEMKFKQIDSERQVLMGPALIPDKPIYRRDDNMGEYHVYFSKNTVRQASEIYMRRGLQASFTLEHQEKMDGCCVVESWIVEGENDKGRAYGFSEPVGTWMVSVKVLKDELWQQFVKSGEVLGFSIEGYFVDKMQLQEKEEEDEKIDLDGPCWQGYEPIGYKIKDGKRVPNCVPIEAEIAKMARTVVVRDKRYKDGKTLMESYSDYPKAVKNNAKRALKWAEKNGWGSCGTAVGKQRANQLANGEPITRATISRMKSYLSRSADNADTPYSEGCGGLMYDAWGGKAGLRWATSKLKKLDVKAAMQEIDETIVKTTTK